jgi:DNA polymerase elongation subunit (family B)
MIEKKLNFFGTQYVMTDLGNVLIEDTLFNSKIIDNKMIIDSHEKGIICPTKKRKEQLEKIMDKKFGHHVSGGYTFCFIKGFHKNLKCFDFAGHYPTDMITHNISPETFVRCYEPDLSLLFAQNEIDFLTQVFKMYETREFLKVDGKLQKKKYEDAIEEIRETYKVEKTMEDFMWAFTENYRDQDMIDYVKENPKHGFFVKYYKGLGTSEKDDIKDIPGKFKEWAAKNKITF